MDLIVVGQDVHVGAVAEQVRFERVEHLPHPGPFGGQRLRCLGHRHQSHEEARGSPAAEGRRLLGNIGVGAVQRVDERRRHRRPLAWADGGQHLDHVVADLCDVAAFVVGVVAPRVPLVEQLLQGHVRHRGDDIEEWRHRPAKPLGDLPVSIVVVEPDQHQTGPGEAPELRRHERRRGRGGRRQLDRVQRQRQPADHIAHGGERFPSLLGTPEEQAELHHRGDVDQVELELGDDAEVATAATQGPEQVGLLGRTGVPDPTVRRNHLGADEMVDGEAAPSGQPPHSSAQREPADPGVADDPGRHRESVLLGGRVEVAEQRTALRASTSALRIDPDAVHPSEVDDQAALAHRVPREAVPSASDGDLQIMIAAVTDRRDHVLGARTSDHRGRSSVDVGVPGPSGLLEPHIERGDHLSVDPVSQCLRRQLVHPDRSLALMTLTWVERSASGTQSHPVSRARRVLLPSTRPANFRS